MSDDVRLEPLTPAEFPTVARLGEAIWRSHYTPIIGAAQVEYMLASRYTSEKLSRYLDSDERWLQLLKLSGEPVGYCSYARTDRPDELKLEQLYLLPQHKGKGLGGFMLRHVEAEGRRLGFRVLMLTVNKNNTDSIAIYKKTGWTLRGEIVIDIGHGFVMDDYVMEKRLD